VSDVRVRFGLGVLAGLVAFGVVLALVNRASPSPKGPRSSSYATSPQGAAAYAAVLERSGHSVRRLRTAVADAPPPAGATLMVLEPDVIEPAEARAIRRWVRAGGRLVVADSGAGWLDGVLDDPPEWDPLASGRHTVLAPVPETAGVREVESDLGGWHKLGGALPLIGPADAPLAVSIRSGRGQVVLLGDATPLQNRGLAGADNAALGVALAGAPGRPVAFLETVHGYGVSRGFGGLPTRVKWVLIGLALAGLLALWSAGRRLGPPEDTDTPLPPPRVEYVDALAAALARAKPDKEEDRS
jgi:hypothetical protein